MLDLRRHLAWIVCSWLACHLAGVVAAPAALWHLTASHDALDGGVCDCPVAPGQACPMHQSGKHDDTTCKMRNAFPASDQALFSQWAAFGILPGSTASVSLFQPGAIVSVSAPAEIAEFYVPDAPPPRA